MYDLLILGTLLRGDKSGYKLRKILESALNSIRSISNGIFYPVLDKLEQHEYVTLTEKQINGRKTKIAHITSLGKKRFFELMEEPVVNDTKRADIMHFKLRALDCVPKQTQIAILTQFKDFTQSDLECYQEAQQRINNKVSTSNIDIKFNSLVDAFTLDVQLAETKLSWAEASLATIQNM